MENLKMKSYYGWFFTQIFLREDVIEFYVIEAYEGSCILYVCKLKYDCFNL